MSSSSSIFAWPHPSIPDIGDLHRLFFGGGGGDGDGGDGGDGDHDDVRRVMLHASWLSDRR